MSLVASKILRHHHGRNLPLRVVGVVNLNTAGTSPSSSLPSSSTFSLPGNPSFPRFQYVNVKFMSSATPAAATKPDDEKEDSKDDSSEVIAGITKKDINVIKDKPWLWDMGISTLLPDWRRMFNPSTLLTDVSAGITVGCVAVPLSLAIAVASGVPPEVGLVTAAVSGVAGGLLGGTTLAITGPAAAISLLVVSAVQQHGLEALPFITLACGGLQVASGVTRLGVLAKLVPVSVIAGFTTGVGAYRIFVFAAALHDSSRRDDKRN